MARISALTAESSLARYLQEIQRFPLLQPAEELALAARWRENGDRNASDRLVTSHLRLVVKIASRYRGYGLPVAEIIAEGNFGLIQAVRRFDPDKGFRLATYAMWWIRASIQEYVLRSWSLVRIGTTVNQRKLFFKLRQAKSQISALEDGDLRPDQVATIANRLGVDEGDVIQMNRRLGGDASLNVRIGEGSESEDWQDRLVDNTPSQERRLIDTEELDNRRTALRETLVVLDNRERRIFTARHLAHEPATLEFLAQKFGISRERVRQIEVRALEKVRRSMRRHVAAEGASPGAKAHPFGGGRYLPGEPASIAASPPRAVRPLLERQEDLAMDWPFAHSSINRGAPPCSAVQRFLGHLAHTSRDRHAKRGARHRAPGPVAFVGEPPVTSLAEDGQ
jgi:RNA polymerase sigma-32 factor